MCLSHPHRRIELVRLIQKVKDWLVQVLRNQLQDPRMQRKMKSCSLDRDRLS